MVPLFGGSARAAFIATGRWRRRGRAGWQRCSVPLFWGMRCLPAEAAFQAMLRRVDGHWRWAGRPEEDLGPGPIGLRSWREHHVLRPERRGRSFCVR